MIFSQKPKKIRVMLTTFRDGLQSSFGGKVRLQDYLPAMKAAVHEIGIRHLEFGGGARYQSPLFYLNENPFETMSKMRSTVGTDVDLQILTRSVSGVTLTTQNLDTLHLQAKLMKKHGTTWDRNFDYMNDVKNLVQTGRPIVEAGLHHQACISLMGLPFKSDRVHTAEFYFNIGKQLLEQDIQIDSLCLKDASGTTDPKTIYDTSIQLKKIMPPEMPLWLHTHDTASMAVSCYMAGIAGGVDGIDLSVRPMASGTVQPDVRSMAHALKGTGYSLDIDGDKIHIIEEILNETMKDYDFNPVTTSPDARVIGFPMPGGAIGPNVHMMVKAGLIHKYSDILAEFPIVVEAGGAWSSVTPGSQQYWLQAFNNVQMGRWEKIDAGYGRSVLGYFGKTPLPPDPKVIEIASKQLGLPIFTDNPLEAVDDNIGEAQKALKENNLEITDENTFLVVSSIVPGKKMQTNEGLRFLLGKGKIDIPLKSTQKKSSSSSLSNENPNQDLNKTITTQCLIEEGGKTRIFNVTVSPLNSNSTSTPASVLSSSPPTTGGEKIPVKSNFAGSVQLNDIKVKIGDKVSEGQVVAQIEAMKATYDIKAPCSGTIVSIHSSIGDEVDSSLAIMEIQK